MKSLNSEALEKNIKKNRLILFIGIIFLSLTIFMIYLGKEFSKSKEKNIINMKNILMEQKKEENIISYIDTITKPYLFGEYKKDDTSLNNKFYFLMDSDNHLYIVYMNDEKFNKLDVNLVDNNSIRIIGKTKLIDEEIKELAIKSYNKAMKDEYLTLDNFYEYVGWVYLDTSFSINDINMYYLTSLVFVIITIFLILKYIINSTKNRKVFKNFSHEDLERIASEVLQHKNSEYSNINIYLLKDYLVDTNESILIIKYKDIEKIYINEPRNNYIVININDKKKYKIANSKNIVKNRLELYNEIVNFVSSKMKK